MHKLNEHDSSKRSSELITVCTRQTHKYTRESNCRKQGAVVQTAPSAALFEMWTCFETTSVSQPRVILQRLEKSLGSLWRQSDMIIHICFVFFQVVSSDVKPCWQSTAASPEGTPYFSTTFNTSRASHPWQPRQRMDRYTVPPRSFWVPNSRSMKL